MRLTMQSKLLFMVYEYVRFFWVTTFVTRLEIITETLLTWLINGNASQYVATFKTTKAFLKLSYISIYMIYVLLIVIDPFAQGTREEYYLAKNI